MAAKEKTKVDENSPMGKAIIWRDKCREVYGLTHWKTKDAEKYVAELEEINAA